MKSISTLFFMCVLTISVSAESVPAFDSIPTLKNQKWRISANGGWGYQLGDIPEDTPPDLVEFAEGMRSGFQFSADGQFFFASYLGIGLKYSWFRAQNERSGKLIDPTLNLTIPRLSEDVRIEFIGASLCARLQPQIKRLNFYLDFSAGRVNYWNEFFIGREGLLLGDAIAVCSDFTVDYEIHKNISISTSLSLMRGKLDELRSPNFSVTQGRTIKLEGEDQISLNRFDASIGLNINF